MKSQDRLFTACATFLAVMLAGLTLQSCTSLTPQQSSAAAGLLDVALGMAASRYGVPPTDTLAVQKANDSLWGAFVQAQASQPVAQGASDPAIGNAIQAAMAGKSSAQQAALLQAAAQLAGK